MSRALKKRPNPIKFGDVEIDRQARERIHTVLESRQITEGRYVKKFEHEFAEKFGFKHAIMVSSGAVAAEVLWMAVAIQRGLQPRHSTVITPALAFGSTANSLQGRGIHPYMVDIDCDLNMAVPPGDPQSIMNYPIGVQFVANMGRMIGVDRIREYAEEWNLFFMIDACEAHGASFRDGAVAEWADAAIYSLYPAHIITCGGEGGMIGTRDDELAGIVRQLKSHGRAVGDVEAHNFLYVGTNAKTTEFAAAVALSELHKFDETFRRRREIRAGLIERLERFPLTLYRDADGEVIAPHAFPLLTGDLARLSDHLREWSIEFKSLWGALSNHPAYAPLGIQRDYFKNAEAIGRHGLHFGCHQNMSDDDLDYIYDVFKLFFQEKS